MDEHSISPRAEYYALVLETVLRYVGDGHELSVKTTNSVNQVSVTFRFEPEPFAAYFQHLGAEVGAADIPARLE